ncbi:hypothetical protein TNCV_5002231 [Trichonephila clavipes]|nr:hypothetical protein TNCV_5002231 [Trichonephila clavipes]
MVLQERMLYGQSPEAILEEFLEWGEEIPTPPAQSVSPPAARPAESIPRPTESLSERPNSILEMVAPSLGAEIEVNSRIPSLITRFDKSSQTDTPTLHFNRLDLGKTTIFVQ